MKQLFPLPAIARTKLRWAAASTLSLAAILGLPSLPTTPPMLPLAAAQEAAAPPKAIDAGIEEAVPPKVQAAVDKALAWLAQNQQPDGSWPRGDNCTTAVPSLATMAFLARGHVPGQGPYGDVLTRAIDNVLKAQREDGLLSASNGNASMYEHGISAAMLSEAYGMVDDDRKRRIDQALQKAVRVILEAQRVKKNNPKDAGGWRYKQTSADADISVTGWQLMALRGAANCGATVPAEALEAGREYVRRCATKKDPGGFTYESKGSEPNAARTGTGILSLELLGEQGSPEALRGGDYLLANPVNNAGTDYYYYTVYYVSQAFNQLGGKYWEQGYPKLRDALLAAQSEQGTWAQGQGQEEVAGEAYRTSMALLALCVPYRYLPLYQK